MVMRQLYYTSCIKGTSGSAGFQVKALSSGISTDERAALNKILGYRIPPSLPVEQVSSHPVALRYQYLSTDTCFLACSQSCGPDEGGRPGNFFAHCVVTAPSDFAVMAPIMYWRHPFWKRSDASESVEIPEEPSFELDPALDFDAIWAFLDQDDRREWLHRLLCVVLRFDKDRRPIVILDSPDNVPLWIAAVTFGLPAPFRPFLSFATYHHDPYQVPFLITGTTADGRFRFSADEYISHFVINASIGKASDAKESAYARYVSRYMQPAAYETTLMEFFDFCNSHLAHLPSDLADRFDSVTELYMALRERSITVAQPSAEASVASFLNMAEGEQALREPYLEDLDRIVELHRDEVLSHSSEPALSVHLRALHLLARHEKAFGDRCQAELRFASQLAAQKDEGGVKQLASAIEQLFARDMLQRAWTEPIFVDTLAKQLRHGGWVGLHLTWSYIVPLLGIEGQSVACLKPLIRDTLDALSVMPSGDGITPPLEAEKLVTALVAAIPGDNRQQFLLDLIAEWKGVHVGPAMGWAYYEIVRGASLERRVDFRKRLCTANPAMSMERIIWVELARDVREAHFPQLGSLFETWVAHAMAIGTAPRALIPKAVALVWPQPDKETNYVVAEQLLSFPLTVDQLGEKLSGELALAYFSNLEIQSLSGRALALAEHFALHEDLTADVRAILGGSLAMTKGKFTEQAIREIPYRFARLDSSKYHEEAGKLIRRFFENDVSVTAHVDMLQATYVSPHQSVFWDLYWECFSALVLRREGASQAVQIISLWFEDSLAVFSDKPYLGPGFFLQLPSVLADLSEKKEFQFFAQILEANSAKLPWSSLIKPYITSARRKGLFTFLSRDR
jgi:GTPase-associated protein 1, N-terminal domain type 2/GTPase-associated protein 1, middle domain